LDLLRTGGILDYTGHSYIRSDRCVDFSESPAHLSDNLIHEFPQYTTDFQLLRVTASRMASILTGEDDPLHRLFGIPRSRALLEDLYINSPMFKVMSRLVSHFLGDVLSNANFDRPIRILEVGAGVGGTTIGLIESLQQTGVPFFYTFSDLSPSLVASSHHKFAKYSNFMEFCVVDIESPPSEMFGSYDIILSTLCIHATRDLTKSLLQINNLLQPNGFVVLAEFTQRLPWLDLVFGLLDGWWLFDDGRSAALAPSYFWERSMTNAGFKQILTTGGCSQESQTASIIAGFKQDQQVDIPKKRSVKLSDLESEVIAFKHDRDVSLQAEIFYPVDVLLQEDRKWPVGKYHPSLNKCPTNLYNSTPHSRRWPCNVLAKECTLQTGFVVTRSWSFAHQC
jgi:SAM-dependent methyltransferase